MQNILPGEYIIKNDMRNKKISNNDLYLQQASKGRVSNTYQYFYFIFEEITPSRLALLFNLLLQKSNFNLIFSNIKYILSTPHLNPNQTLPLRTLSSFSPIVVI